jgi:hypothetical protein
MDADEKRRLRMNIRLSMVVSLCSGLLTGIFALSLRYVIDGSLIWLIVLGIVTIVIAYYLQECLRDITAMLKE